jgi:hypothetical protein
MASEVKTAGVMTYRLLAMTVSNTAGRRTYTNRRFFLLDLVGENYLTARNNLS